MMQPKINRSLAVIWGKSAASQPMTNQERIHRSPEENQAEREAQQSAHEAAIARRNAGLGAALTDDQRKAIADSTAPAVPTAPRIPWTLQTPGQPDRVLSTAQQAVLERAARELRELGL